MYRVRHKTSRFFKQLKRYITPFRETLELKLGEFWKIQEILFMMGTEIFQFGPIRAEKTRFEVTYPTLKNHHQSHLL